MNKLIKGTRVRKLHVLVVSMILCTALLTGAVCQKFFKKDSNANNAESDIAIHKNISRDINLKADSSGKLSITKPTMSNYIKMGTENKWTLFIYLVDNCYGSENCYKLLDLFKKNYLDEQVQDKFDIIIQCCPSENNSNETFTANKITRAKITTSGFEVIEQLDKANMADATTLYNFLDWGVSNYASEHMMVHILGNGYNSLDGRYGLAEDSSYQDGLTINEIEEAFSRQIKSMTCKFDGILFNQSGSGLLEYANLLSPYVEKMIGVTSGSAIWDYSIITHEIVENPDMSFDELAKIICDTFDFQCSLEPEGKEYTSNFTLSSSTEFNDFSNSEYGIGVYDLDKVNDVVTSLNQIAYQLYGQLTKSRDIDTLKEFTSLSEICGEYSLTYDSYDINTLIRALSKLTKIQVDTTSIASLLDSYIIYSHGGRDVANNAQLNIIMPLFGLDYECYPTDKINYFRNIVVSPYILNTIDYLYAKHWDSDTSNLYKWESSKYYFEDNFGFIPSNLLITNAKNKVDESKEVNEETFFDIIEVNYKDYKAFTDQWKSLISCVDQNKWVSFSTESYNHYGKYYAHAFTQFKDLQKYWKAYNAAYLTTEKGYIMLGEQSGATIDNETGIMHTVFDYEWIMLADGQFVRTNIEKNPDQTIYSIPIYTEAGCANIRIEETLVSGKKNLTVLGVYDTDNENKLCDLEAGMSITPVYDIYDIKQSEYLEDATDVKMPWISDYGDEYIAKGIDDFLYGKLPQDKTTVSFAIMKYNGNIYYDVSNLEPLEQQYLYAYTENVTRNEHYNYQVLNNLLRGLPVNESVDLDRANHQIDVVSEALAKASLTEDMTLYRGCSKKSLGEYIDLPAAELIGKTITEPAFLSTTKDKSITENFTKDLVITINAKKGAHGLYLKDISGYEAEEEVLFNKNQAMLITAAEEIDGVLHITVTIE